MQRLTTPRRLTAAGLVLLLLAGVLLFAVPSQKYIFLPDEAHRLDAFVKVDGARADPDGGGIYYVDVVVRKATLLERLIPGLHDGATLVPESAVRPQGVSESVRRSIDRQDMVRSQVRGAAVALRALGYKVTVRQTGALVVAVAKDAPAAGRLAPGDIVVSVNGRPVKTRGDLRRLVGARPPGTRLRIGVRARGGLRTVTIRSAGDPNHPGRPVIGVFVDQAAQVQLPVDVDIDLGDVGGPSAGLAFALEVMEKLGRDVDRGYKVAVTGGIELDGTVEPIGGVKQKTFGAREAGVDVFVVPAGDNAREASRYADGLRVIPVKSFRQALRALATLPPRARAA